jgi:multidrug efflux pump subunit AcrA (membrane-fusion protein)
MFTTSRAMLKLSSLAAILSLGLVTAHATVEERAAVGERTPLDDSDKVYTVRAQTMPATVTVGATVIPDKVVTLAAQLPGRVEHLAGEEGDRFAQGKLLARLDDDALQANRRAAVAQAMSAEMVMRNAGVQYHRELVAPREFGVPQGGIGGMGMPSMMDQMFTKPMAEMMGMPQHSRLNRHTDLYGSFSQVEQARSSLLQAQARIREIDSKVRDTRSIAPFDGVILRKFVEVGDPVQPGQPMLEFADTERLQLRADVPQRLVAGLKVGTPVEARLDVGDVMVTATVDRIFPAADEVRHTVRVELDVPPDAPASSGMYAEVMVPDPKAGAKTVLMVPKSSLVYRSGLPRVYVMGADGKAELRLVRVGEAVDADHVIVLSGLRDGEKIETYPGATAHPSDRF